MNGSTVTLIDRYYWVSVRLKPVFDGEIFENLNFSTFSLNIGKFPPNHRTHLIN